MKAATASGWALAAALIATSCTADAPQRSGPATVTQSGVLAPWYEAALESAQRPATVVVLGDSVSEGWGLRDRLERRWIDRLQVGLRERLTPDCETAPGGWFGTASLVPADYAAASLPDPGRSGDIRPVETAGPGGRSLALAPGASLTWELRADEVDVGYRTTPGGGDLSIAVDGDPGVGVPVIDTAVEGTDPGGREVWESWALGDGSHRVTATNVSPAGGGLVTVTDARSYRGDRDRCIHVLDASRSGVTLAQITRTPDYLADSLALEPDLLLVPLGFNDARTGQTPDRFAASIDALVTQARALDHHVPILLVGLHEPPDDLFEHPWSDYLAVMREAAPRHEGVSFIDLSVAMPASQRGPSGAYLDALHPSPEGMRRIAEALLDPLTPRGVSTPTMSPAPEDGHRPTASTG